MAKAGAPKKKKAKPKLTDKEQSERFKRTARELGVDESGERFERAIDGVLGASNRQHLHRTKPPPDAKR
jgi:hypothetical protein